MADDFKPCAVTHCNGNAHYSADGATGLCSMHYRRARRHGDPLGGRAFPGEAEAWLAAHLKFTGAECLIWPFAKATSGYGYLRVEGALRGAHREMCRLVNGPAPAPNHEAAHNCGNGHLGCVHPLHLRWATPKENHADIPLHAQARQAAAR